MKNYFIAEMLKLLSKMIMQIVKLLVLLGSRITQSVLMIFFIITEIYIYPQRQQLIDVTKQKNIKLDQQLLYTKHQNTTLDSMAHYEKKYKNAIIKSFPEE